MYVQRTCIQLSYRIHTYTAFYSMFLILDSIYINIQCFNFLCTYAKIECFHLPFTYINSVFLCQIHTFSVSLFLVLISNTHVQYIHAVFAFIIHTYISFLLSFRMRIISACIQYFHSLFQDIYPVFSSLKCIYTVNFLYAYTLNKFTLLTRVQFSIPARMHLLRLPFIYILHLSIYEHLPFVFVHLF